MELSSAQSSDILKSNRYTLYAHATNNENIMKCDIFTNDNARIAKSTPRKCKINSEAMNESKMKKSSSLHNMEKVGELIPDEVDNPNLNSINIGRSSLLDKPQMHVNNELLTRIEREKKTYEARISELILNVETRKKEKEMLSLENKRLTETVQNLQMDIGKLREVSGGLRTKMIELGVVVEVEDDVATSDVIDASGDGGTGHSCTSLTLATVGDTESVSSDEWVPPAGAERDFLNSLSVSTLQDRIQKMEEDSYCTNEELQATMQELLDLQRSLDTINEENRNLTFERAILLESLCEQTRKLQQSRLLSNNLKFLLLSNNSHDYPNLDAKLRELYTVSEEENCALLSQNEEFKQTILNYQNECHQLISDVDDLNKKVCNERSKYTQLEEKYRDELWQREQVESVLKSHSEIFVKTSGWTDCSSGVLALIQQSKGQKQTETCLKNDINEKNSIIEGLHAQIRQLEEGMRQGMKNKEENRGNIHQLQSQLDESEHEIYILGQTLDILRQKYAEDLILWRGFERDLLTSITAANSLKEDRDKDLVELEMKLEASEKMRKQLQEKLDSHKSCLSSQNKDRVITSREQSSLSNTNSVKTLIQSLEYQMKPGSSGIKPQSHIVTLSNHTNTVPRSSITSKVSKNEITRTNTVKVEPSPSKNISDITIQKSSSFKNEIPQKPQLLPSPESCQPLLQPLTNVVSQASSILQSVSRRNSLVTNPILEHHSSYSPPAPTKPPSPQPPSTDPLSQLVKKTNKGSKRNALLYWCQSRTSGYQKIDITNFSSSWNDGLALCALLHSFDPLLVDFKKLADATPSNPDKSQKRNNFRAAFNATEKLGIPSLLDIEAMISVERPNWNSVMNFVVEIYIHFESQDADNASS